MLRLFAVLAVLSAVSSVVTAGNVGVTLDSQTGAYNLTIGGHTFLQSGKFYVQDSGDMSSTADGTLKLAGTGAANGRDALGPWTGYTLSFVTSHGHTMNGQIRVYDSFVVFKQSFPQGMNGTSVGNKDALSTAFPSFDYTLSLPKPMGYLAYSGDMTGSSPHFGSYPSADIPGGTLGGPLAVFTADLETSFVISSASSFMMHTCYNIHDMLHYGVAGEVEALPAGYSMETIVYVGSGVNTLFDGWGKTMRQYYGKDMAFKARDMTLQFLGYSTDNGAFYYYKTENNKTYEQTLIDVKAYADKEQLPYKWILLDSWWYYKGPQDGVTEWLAMPSIFPDGIDTVFNKTWPIQGHNRYWSGKNVYAKQNGGDWDFIFTTSGGRFADIGVPTQQEFWDWFLASSKKWGLTTYEQDWLDDEFDNIVQFHTDPQLARNWLIQMGKGAAKSALGIQYCMSHCRHIMQSLEIPSVTQARASGDYQPGNDQWMVGVSSMFAHAVGIAPTKDNYWSTPTEIGGGRYPTKHEPYNRLQAAVSTLTSGPVAPSDAVGASNPALIMMSCMQDGTLLQHDRPAMNVDSYYVSHAGVGSGPTGEVWHGYSNVAGSQHSSVLVAATLDVKQSSWDMPLTELGYDATASLAVIEANSTTDVHMYKGSDTLTTPAAHKYDFALFSVAPVLGNGWAVIGETAKWVPVNNARVQNVAWDGDGLEVTLRGTPGETISFSFYDTGASKLHTVSCSFSQSSAAVASMPAGTCLTPPNPQ